LSRLPLLEIPAASGTIAKLGFRPANPEILQKYSGRLQNSIFSRDPPSQGSGDAQYKFFGEHGIVDTVLKPAFP